MHRGKKTKERAQANKEAQEIAKAKADKLAAEQNQQQPPQAAAQEENEPPEENAGPVVPDEEADLIGTEPEPAGEHTQPLEIWSPLQISPGVNSEGKPINTKGRKGLYTDEICLVVEKLAGEGFTDIEIANKIGLGIRTFYEWKHKYPHFSQALAKYRGLAEMYVENALYRAALGYNYEEEQAVRGEMGTDVVVVKKHKTGDVAAQKFILTNRKADRWKQKVTTEIQLGDNISQMAFAIKRRED